MKKLLCFLLILITMLSLASCRVARGMPLADESGVSNANSAENSFSPTKSNISPLLWKVTSKDGKNTLWLFGSIHLADENAYPLPDAVMNAYKSSSALAVECDPTDSNMSVADMMKLSTYADGSTIKNHISEELYLDAKKILTEIYGSKMASEFDQYKPVMWYSIIEQYYILKSEFDSKYGIDTYFLSQCKSDKKELLEVESAKFQYELLFGFSDEIQELMLAELVRAGHEGYNNVLAESYKAWAKGDLEALEARLYEDMSKYSEKEVKVIEEYNKLMITDRNIHMAEKAKQYLAQGKDVFFVVGELHMVGENGIVKLLTDAGYKVEQVQTNAENSL